MTAKLSVAEKAIIEYQESNHATNIDNVENEKNRYTQNACAQMRKKSYRY
jgi:hypothetical protein